MSRTQWRWGVLAIIVGLGVTLRGQESGRAPDSSTPRLVASVPIPAYPPVARERAIEGPVRYRATVRPDGSVASVTVLQVPQSDVGFDLAVEAAVKQWRFSPSSQATGEERTYAGVFNFELSIPSEWIYPMASRDVWGYTVDLVKALKFRTGRREDDRQLIVTDWQTYPTGFPDAGALGLPPGFLPEMVQLHLRVAPHQEPARIAVGSIIQAKQMGRRRSASTIYSSEAFAAWIIGRLSERMGGAIGVTGAVAHPTGGTVETPDAARRLGLLHHAGGRHPSAAPDS